MDSSNDHPGRIDFERASELAQLPQSRWSDEEKRHVARCEECSLVISCFRTHKDEGQVAEAVEHPISARPTSETVNGAMTSRRAASRRDLIALAGAAMAGLLLGAAPSSLYAAGQSRRRSKAEAALAQAESFGLLDPVQLQGRYHFMIDTTNSIAVVGRVAVGVVEAVEVLVDQAVKERITIPSDSLPWHTIERSIALPLTGRRASVQVRVVPKSSMPSKYRDWLRVHGDREAVELWANPLGLSFAPPEPVRTSLTNGQTLEEINDVLVTSRQSGWLLIYLENRMTGDFRLGSLARIEAGKMQRVVLRAWGIQGATKVHIGFAAESLDLGQITPAGLELGQHDLSDEIARLPRADLPRGIDWLQVMDASVAGRSPQMQVALAVFSLGGSVLIHSLDGEPIAEHLRTFADKSRLPPAFEIQTVNLDGRSLTAASLKVIGAAKSLQGMMASATGIDEEMCGLLAENHSQLHWLRLNHCPIGDRGLEKLAGLSSLRMLELADCQLTDASLDALLLFKNLTHLNVSVNKFTPATLDRLRRGLPAGCKLIVD